MSPRNYSETLATVAATLAAALNPRDVDDAIAKYRKVMNELRKEGLYGKGASTQD